MCIVLWCLAGFIALFVTQWSGARAMGRDPLWTLWMFVLRSFLVYWWVVALVSGCIGILSVVVQWCCRLSWPVILFDVPCKVVPSYHHYPSSFNLIVCNQFQWTARCQYLATEYDWFKTVLLCSSASWEGGGGVLSPNNINDREWPQQQVWCIFHDVTVSLMKLMKRSCYVMIIFSMSSFKLKIMVIL